VSEEGGGGEGVVSEVLSPLSYTLRYVSLARRQKMPVWVVITDTLVFMRE
jgi:hypothetical protein